MMENKKIKKLEKVNRNSTIRFKKSNLKPSRAQVGTISKPVQVSDGSEVFMIESDFVFGKKDNEFSFDVSMLNHFKYITSVEVRKDLNEKVVTLLLESQQTPCINSWNTLSKDFEDEDSASVQKFAEPLTAFGAKHENFLKEYNALKKENNMQKKIFLYKMREQTAAKRLYLLSTYPAFEMRYRMKKEEIKCTELCFNETFLREAGYTLENFTSNVLSEGLPQFFPPDSIAAIKTLQNVMENYMTNESESPEQEMDLLMKTGYRKKITFQTVMLVELSDQDLIMSLVFYMKSKSLPFGSYQKQPYTQEFLEILKSQDKEKEYLFGTYYGEKYLGLHSNTEKVCKIKELALP